MWSPHSNVAYRGKHTHGCSALTDKCHINMSQITFTPPPQTPCTHTISIFESPCLKFVSFICWQPFTLCHLLCHHGRQVHCPTSFWSSKENGVLLVPFLPDLISCSQCSKHFKILYVVMPNCPVAVCTKSEVQKTKVSPTFFFFSLQDTWPDMISPQLRPPATQSQRSWLFTFTSHPHWLSDQTAAGTHIMPFPPASTSYPHRNLVGIHVWAEVNHCKDQSLTAKIYLCTCEWLSEWKF